MSTLWMTRGACRRADVDPEIFFAPDGRPQMKKQQLQKAQAVCWPCPVRRQCLRWALANPQLTEYGIWAATTPRERRAIRAARSTQEVAS